MERDSRLSVQTSAELQLRGRACLHTVSAFADFLKESTFSREFAEARKC